MAAEALGHGEEPADCVGVGHISRQAQVGGESPLLSLKNRPALARQLSRSIMHKPDTRPIGRPALM